MRLYLRKATIKDSKFLWNLRNQKKVRENSFDSRKISYPQHREWLSNSPRFARIIFCVVREGGQSIGQVRLDIRAERVYVNIAISRKFHNRGYGTCALKIASEKIIKMHNLKYVIAYVKENNIPSLKCFKKVGYLDNGRIAINGYCCRELLLKKRWM